MWFIRLVKLKNPPSKQLNEAVDAKRAEAEKWGVKFHDVFYTLGKYDIVSIFEAPDEKVAMRFAMSLAPEASGQTLVAISRDEVNSWLK
jgi:uncharacterized protein with GYD domain